MRHNREKRQFYPKISQFYPEFLKPMFTDHEAKPQKMPQKRKKRLENMVFSSLIGGEEGIRTLVTFPSN